ncbi:monosaccharide ABC transporter membrane protein, CUT2 family [Mycolicibacterium rutilum]|uniref:Monosaccharide ABC transporter membrane protein, CUT2 family n=1 Tax=Mycolicibacterium rutilum TaxID=370526 RepID=A0A1H6IEY5_MYCRU|nr:ABC transporter permease [Mycolicibacterium rutilum]SEH46975.1 monosaccharide ABC transporter membrane protein, CUT2 family [Mycolicibacterium rutilum]
MTLTHNIASPKPAEPEPSPRRPHRTLGERIDTAFVPGVLLLLIVYLGATNDAFLSTMNITNVLTQASILAIVSFAATFVIMAGQLDLSMGSASALISVLGATAMVQTGSALQGIAVCLAVGVVLGLLNGAIVTYLEVPSFIATLGTMIICGAIALALTNGGVVTGLPEGFRSLSTLRIAGLPLLVWLTVVVFFVLWWLQRQTVFGYRVLAVGGNAEAARLSGISIQRITMLVFLITGVASALAGLALLIRVQSGQPNANATLALEAIAAVVVGGTSLNGGRGSIVRTLWGVLLIAVLRNGLDISGISEDYKNVVVGAVLIAAASVDFLRRRFVRSRRQSAALEPAPPDQQLAQPSRSATNRGEAE